MCMFCRSLFVLLYFFFWPLCCLFFFDIRILIAPLVSSNSSCHEHPSSPPVFSGVRVSRSLIFYVVFCRSLCLLFLLAIALSVLRFTASQYPFQVSSNFSLQGQTFLEMLPVVHNCNRDQIFPYLEGVAEFILPELRRFFFFSK